jgi:hypothetical protein
MFLRSETHGHRAQTSRATVLWRGLHEPSGTKARILSSLLGARMCWANQLEMIIAPKFPRLETLQVLPMISRNMITLASRACLARKMVSG